MHAIKRKSDHYQIPPSLEKEKFIGINTQNFLDNEKVSDKICISRDILQDITGDRMTNILWYKMKPTFTNNHNTLKKYSQHQIIISKSIKGWIKEKYMRIN